MYEVIKTLEYKGFKIEIYPDDSAESPREWGNTLGTMTCFHNRYNLGDKFDYRASSDASNNSEVWLEYMFHNHIPNAHWYDDGEDFERIQKWVDKNVITLPLYLYDHSGCSISTTSFSCPWDSGCVGLIWVTKEQIRKEYSWARITKSRKDQVVKRLISEVNTYDQYLTGDVYRYKISHPTIAQEETDELGQWGFYGDDHEKSELLSEARGEIDGHINYMRQKKLNAVKVAVKNRIPLLNRPPIYS